jgi:RNA polymerase sigma factor (sigma-70 family)
MTEVSRTDGPATDLVRQYLDEIGSFALLTADEEVALAKRIEAGVYAAAQLSGTATTTRQLPPSRRRDLTLVAEDGRRAKEHMIRANLRLVVAVVRRYNRHRLPMLDAVQEGNLGLIRAVEKFDYTKGFKFSTYATWWIRQAVDRGVADQSRTIRLPVHVVEEVNKVRAMERKLTVRLGHEPTVDELATESGKPADRISELHRIARQVISLDSPLGDDGADLSLGQFVDDADQTSGPDIVERAALAADVRASVAALPPRESRVITLRYGLRTGRTSTLQEVATELRVSRERVRQLELHALRLLRGASQPSLLPWAEDRTSVPDRCPRQPAEEQPSGPVPPRCRSGSGPG